MKNHFPYELKKKREIKKKESIEVLINIVSILFSTENT